MGFKKKGLRREKKLASKKNLAAKKKSVNTTFSR